MYGPVVRLVMLVVALTLAVIYIPKGHSGGWWMLTAALLFIYGYFRYGSIHAAFSAYKRGNIRRVRRLIAATWPRWLRAQERAYYDWLAGVLFLHDEQPASARPHLEAAVRGPLRGPHARAWVHCLLADVAIQLGEIEVAREYLCRARALEHRSEVDDRIHELEERIASRA